ncbi:MAG: hypothetical protein LC749_20900, partial [Actinobacteria bacterium]|nr:hypothetical protein [Actinomycetota bacterium]
RLGRGLGLVLPGAVRLPTQVEIGVIKEAEALQLRRRGSTSELAVCPRLLVTEELDGHGGSTYPGRRLSARARLP